MQFHPEKSGAAGARYLDRVLSGGEGAIPLPRLIPCLDVAGGRVVKGVKFQELRDVGDPVELGAAYSDRGADELVFLDVKATLEERDTLVGVVRRVAEQLAIPFTVGGGIRTVADADALLSAGADKVSVNSAALAGPSLITSSPRSSARRRSSSRSTPRTGACARGPARPRPRAARSSGRSRPRSAGRARSCSRRSTPTARSEGYDLEITRAVADAVSVPVIASGGAGNARHVAEALEVAQAALLASILHEDPERLTSLRDELRELGVALRDAA